jgi:hypothetical protein
VLTSNPQPSVRAVPPQPKQAAIQDEELYRVLLAEVRRGSRLALLGEDEALVQRLQAAGCTLGCFPLSGPGPSARGTYLSDETRGALDTLKPEVVVLLDGWVAVASPETLLKELHAAAPMAALALSFHNAASACSLVSLLAGGGLGASATEEQVRQWLSASGLSLHRRLLVRDSQPERKLARDTEQALLQLFQQLNPSSSASRLLYWVCNTIETTSPTPQSGECVPGLLSVIIRNQNLSRLDYLDHAIFSLACQDYAQLEIVISSQSQEQGVVEAIQQVLERHQSVGGYSYQILREPSSQDIRARLLNLGIRAARGQYIAFLDDDDVIYPQHYARLVELLQKGHAAWAVGRTQRAYFRKGPQGELYCYNKFTMPRPDSFDLAALVNDNYITCHSYVLDRTRVGRFPLEFPEQMTVLEDYVFLLRMSALFRPDFLAGPASCEYRIRDDGSNSVMTENLSGQLRTERQNQWAIARHITDLSKRSVQMLMSESEFERHLERTRQQAVMSVEASARSTDAQKQIFDSLRAQPRFQIVDKANSALKQHLPRAHQGLKSLAKRLLR